MTLLLGPRIAVMVTKSLGLGPAHRFMRAKDASLGTAVTGGIRVESQDLVTTIGTAARRAERRT